MSDSHRGQAYFSSLPGVDIHCTLRVTSQASYEGFLAINSWLALGCI
jgi:hypothetical protein